jgi:hypothetical protein
VKPRQTKNVAAEVRQALSDGKLTDRSVPVWQAAYEREPERVRAELRTLAAPRVNVAAVGAAETMQRRHVLASRTGDRVNGRGSATAALFSEHSQRGSGLPIAGSDNDIFSSALATDEASPLAQATGETLGTRPRTLVNALLAGGSSPAPEPAAAQLTRTVHGNVLYGGEPTKLSAAGEHQVYYEGSWLDISEFERRGLTPADSALSRATASTVGNSETLRILNEGPNSALGVI